jgi:hypothetical protein
MGDMDEFSQQLVALMSGYISGTFLTGLVLPPGSTLPTSNQGPVAMGSVWYFWDVSTGQYLPQTAAVKLAKNVAKNCVYQVQQYMTTTALPAGITQLLDLVLVRSTVANVLTPSIDVGPLASPDNDECANAIKYTVGPTTVPAPAAADLYCHEHLIEGADLLPLQGQVLSLGCSIWASVAGTYSVYLTSGGRDSSYVANFTITSAQLSTWVRIKVPDIPAIPATGTWHYGEGQTGMYIGVVMGVGTQWQVSVPNLNTWQGAFFAGSPNNSATFLATGNNQLKVSGIKLEASQTCTYLTVPSFPEDLHELIRYYFTTFTYQSLTAGVPMTFVASASNAAYGAMVFPRRMCKAPTVVPYSWTAHTAGTVTELSTSNDLAVATLPSTAKGVGGQISATSNKGDVLAALIVADARLT